MNKMSKYIDVCEHPVTHEKVLTFHIENYPPFGRYINITLKKEVMDAYMDAYMDTLTEENKITPCTICGILGCKRSVMTM
jgi:hypothetical protein